MTPDLESLKAAYRKAALALHPDHNPDPEAHHRFRTLTDEYRHQLKFFQAAADFRRFRTPRANDLSPEEQLRLLHADWKKALNRWTEGELEEVVRGLPRRVWALAALASADCSAASLTSQREAWALVSQPARPRRT
ncbi:MAG: DnaJ domain-containing protein [Spirochaetales bacterium]